MELCIFLVLTLAQLSAAIWPIPSKYSHGSSVLWMDMSCLVTYTDSSGASATYSSASVATSEDAQVPLTSSGIVETAIRRTYGTIFSQNFIPWKFHPRNADFEPSLMKNATTITKISLVQLQSDAHVSMPVNEINANESYTIAMTAKGKVTITANSSVGIAYALTTFTQIFYTHTNGEVYTNLAPVKIQDSPRFAHRGLNLDVARSFYPVAVVLRTIDALAYNKFNRLHLHISDSQSWPLQIPKLPKLASKGAYREDLSYSPADLRRIQHYGSSVGVEVYLEFDMPGHTSSIYFGYPELIAAFNVQPDWQTYAAEPPSGTLKLNSSAVYQFLGTFWDDILPRVTPYSSHLHTGGDEVNFNAYMLDETVRSADPAVLRPLLQRLVDTNHARIRAAGLTPIVWEEILLDYNLTIGSDVIVQAWLSDASVAAVVESGHKVIGGNYDYWYMDCGQGQWLDFEIGAASEKFWPYADYCSPRKNWRLMYSYDPLAGVPNDVQHLVLGGECHMWSEQTDPINLDRMLWPRACAAGEVLWSGAKDAQGQNRSQIEASPRLAEMRERLVARGVMAEPERMPFCTMNGTQCALANTAA